MAKFSSLPFVKNIIRVNIIYTNVKANHVKTNKPAFDCLDLTKREANLGSLRYVTGSFASQLNFTHY